MWEQPQNFRISPEEVQKKMPPMKQRRTGLLTVLEKQPGNYTCYILFYLGTCM